MIIHFKDFFICNELNYLKSPNVSLHLIISDFAMMNETIAKIKVKPNTKHEQKLSSIINGASSREYSPCFKGNECLYFMSCPLSLNLKCEKRQLQGSL